MDDSHKGTEKSHEEGYLLGVALFFRRCNSFLFLVIRKDISFCIRGTDDWPYYFRLDVSFLMALYCKSVIISEYSFTLTLVSVALSLVFGLLAERFVSYEEWLLNCSCHFLIFILQLFSSWYEII